MTETAAILLELRALRAEVQELLALQRPKEPDRAVAARLLPLIAQRYGSAAFTASDCREDFPDVAHLSAKKIGMVLASCVNQSVAGLTVERCGVEINVTLWRAVKVVK